MTLSLSRRAERFPDRTAIVDISEERLYAPAETIHEDRITYDGLSGLADWAGARLSGLGIGAGDTVCLVSRNRVLSLVLLFACRRVGAALAPISHLLTPVTVERPFEVLDPDLVVAEPAQRDLVRSIPFDRTVTFEKLVDVEPAADWRDRSDESQPLLLLHGDEGRPVAAFSARTLEWNCITALVTWGLTQDDVAPLTTPLSTPDGLVRIALPMLYAGGRLLLDRAFDPGDALTAMAAENATLLSGRTSVFRDLAAEPASEVDAAVDSIERAIPDAMVGDDVLEPYRERGISVSRAYGRLECPTVLAETGERGELADGSVGRPVLDCRARLVDDGGSVIEGEGTGRLEVAGPILAEGHLGGDGSGSSADRDTWGVGDRTADDLEDDRAEPTEREPQDGRSADGSRFVDGWFDTGQSFTRDDAGTYFLH